MIKSLFSFLLLSQVLLVFGQDRQVFLIGDTGEPRFPSDPNFEFLKQKLDQASADDILIFLGDNIYPRGLPSLEDPDRPALEEKLNAQLDLIKSFQGKSFMIPGNHDWDKGGKDGWNRIQQMDRYVTQYLDDPDVFLPKGGCPGPEVIELDDLVLLIIDTQYLLHPWDKPEEDSDCEFKSELELLNAIGKEIKRHYGKHILIAGHHPLLTNGLHGGASNLRMHLFPLSYLNKKLYLPLPGLGSIYPFYRKYMGHVQDVNNPRYQQAKGILFDYFSEIPNVVYASGHDHDLEYITHADDHMIVSGSGSKSGVMRKSKKSSFQSEDRGFAVLNYSNSGKVNLKFWNGDQGKLIYEKDIYRNNLVKEVASDQIAEIPEGNKTIFASNQYKAGGFKRFMLGDNYRDEWEQEVEVPFSKMDQEFGGLEIIKRGGGMQTKSLRLKNPEGRQYVFRSVDKDVSKAVPLAIQNTFAQYLVQDQISSSHPYGAFVVPGLAELAGIYHANPELRFIPDDPRLKEHRQDFRNTLVLMEERPSKKWVGAPQFGAGAKKIDGTFDILDELREDNDNRVDQPFVLKNRLFDLWLGDWDRHDDQWRWAIFDDPDGKGDLYRPIPRDRDQAFFISNGVLPWLYSRKWTLPRLEGFDEAVRWAPGLAFNGRYFDRSFLNQLSRKEWSRVAKELQGSLTDQGIDEALTRWPEPIQKLTKDEVLQNLKARRSQIPDYAIELYDFLAREVDVVGSDKHELFEVDRRNDDTTRVTVYKRKKDGEISQVIYQRDFLKDETKEVRLYGLGGDDVYKFSGEVKNGLKVRVIDTKGDDRMIDLSKVRGMNKKTLVYADKGTKINPSGETKVHRLSKSQKSDYAYNRKSFQYDVLMPQLKVLINPDDGLFLGGGVISTIHGWEKDPFKQKHQLVGSGALATGAFNLKYKSWFSEVFGDWGVHINYSEEAPFFVNNFFGLGNETTWEPDEDKAGRDDPIDFYRLRMSRSLAGLSLYCSKNQKLEFHAGTKFRRLAVNAKDNTFLDTASFEFSGVDLNKVEENHSYLGGFTSFSYKIQDHPYNPTRALGINMNAETFMGMNDRSEDFSKVGGDFTLIFSFKPLRRFAFANRIGAEHTFGDFEFFNASTLGGRQNIRGFRRSRFYGGSVVYHNFDLRINVAHFRSFLFPGQFGVHGFRDIGRVFLDGEDSSQWHDAIGGGIWIMPASTLVFTFDIAKSGEEVIPAVNMGFFF